ncbi:MAG TPA: redoxin domain-containing protein, partial [Solirubrobacteraceae bacterium]
PERELPFDRREPPGELPAEPPPILPSQRYGRYVALLAILILVLITINTAVTKPNGATGLTPGTAAPPFAVPLVLGNLPGAADVATHANEGAAGRVPACKERGQQILNICEQYEKGPVVLALFVDAGACAQVLGDMQGLTASFPAVRFAAVSIKGDRTSLRELVRSRGLTFPVGIDADGALAALYKVASCPQLTLIYPGGVVQSPPLLRRPPPGVLRARVSELLAAARARGWRGPAG